MKFMKSRFLALAFGLLASASAFAANPVVEMKTNLGSFTLELYPDKAPKTVENFLRYVKGGFYKGTVFHRVIGTFMIQGGGYDASLLEKDTFPPIQYEADTGLKNEMFTIAMARTANPNSARSQFFINVKDNPQLNHVSNTPRGWGYAVFGKVIKGTEVVMKIAKVPTGARGSFSENAPLENVVIEDVTLLAQPAR